MVTGCNALVAVKVNGHYCWDILLSQQMLDAIITSFMTIVFQQDSAQHGASCIQHSPTAAVQNSQLSFSWAMTHNTSERKFTDYEI